MSKPIKRKFPSYLYCVCVEMRYQELDRTQTNDRSIDAPCAKKTLNVFLQSLIIMHTIHKT